MHEDVIATLLAAHADYLVCIKTGDKDQMKRHVDQTELGPLLHIAERLSAVLKPVTPTPVFRTNLRQELLAAAARRAEERGTTRQIPLLRRKMVLIGAAAVIGSALSVAGIVVALLWRQRFIARTSQAT